MDDLTDLLFFLLISANKLPLTSVSLFTQTYNTYSLQHHTSLLLNNEKSDGVQSRDGHLEPSSSSKM